MSSGEKEGFEEYPSINISRLKSMVPNPLPNVDLSKETCGAVEEWNPETIDLDKLRNDLMKRHKHVTVSK